MKTIYKYQIKEPNDVKFQMPSGAEILTVRLQDLVTIWALVTPTNLLETRRFKLIMTGEEIGDGDSENLKYIGSVQRGTVGRETVFVGHLFEDLTNYVNGQEV